MLWCFFETSHEKNGETDSGVGVLSTRPYPGRTANMGSKLASWYMNNPLKMQNMVYEWVDFSKFSQI